MALSDPLSQAHSHLLNSAMNYAGGRLDAADRKATLLLTAAGAWAGFVVADLRSVPWPENIPLIASLALSLAALLLALLAVIGKMRSPKGWFSSAMFGQGPIEDIQGQFAQLQVPDLFSDWLGSLRVIGELVQRKTKHINRGIYCLLGSVTLFLVQMVVS